MELNKTIKFTVDTLPNPSLEVERVDSHIIIYVFDMLYTWPIWASANSSNRNLKFTKNDFRKSRKGSLFHSSCSSLTLDGKYFHRKISTFNMPEHSQDIYFSDYFFFFFIFKLHNKKREKFSNSHTHSLSLPKSFHVSNKSPCHTHTHRRLRQEREN